MLLNMCTVILTVFCKTMAYDTETTPSVGTVLFSKNDIQKPDWTRTQISLLQARRYFQTILPLQDFKNSYDDDYVDRLLAYIKDGYSNIKREALDLETDSIMTAAFSDTLGGYFKAWVLPVAKLNYYGGTLSQDNVIKLFQFYGELKSYLDTDGMGWCPPDNKFLNSVSINVAPTLKSTGDIVDPCEQLAYFEKTPNGLGIPLPKVNWNDKSSTLFVPLKNMTLIPMIARDTSDTLVKYYDIAKSCLAESHPKDIKKFDKKFQLWLLNNVMPHLKDEPLYLALGNVLTLTNMTRSHYENMAHKDRAAEHSFICEPITSQVPSRKVTIILVILFLELAWCIPALIYVLCRKKKKDCSSNVYLFIDQNKTDKQNKTGKQTIEKTNSGIGKKTKAAKKEVHITQYGKTIESKNLETQFPSTAICRTSTFTSALQLGTEKETYYMEFQGQYPSSNLAKTAGTGSQAYYSSKNQACETVHIAPTPRDSKTPRAVENKPSVTLSRRSEVTHTAVNKLVKNISYIKDSKTPMPSNRNHVKGSKNISQKRSDRSKDKKAVLQIKPDSKNDDKSFEAKTVKTHPGILKTPELVSLADSKIGEIEKEQSSLFYFADSVPICPCTGCIHNINDIHEEILSGSLVAKEKHFFAENTEIPNLSSNMPHYSDKQVIEIKSVRPVKEFIKSTRSKRAVIEVRDTTKKFYQTTIERPMTEINVNIGAKQITTQSRRSKIPKRSSPSKLLISKLSGRIQRALSPSKESKKKSLIPLLTKKALDDMALNMYCYRSNANCKFNDTI